MRRNIRAFTPLENFFHPASMRTVRRVKNQLSKRAIKLSFLTGFTLIEMLLGLMIFSIIALSLYGVLHSGFEINKRVEHNDQIYREIHLALNRMSYDLENMAPFDFSNADLKRVAFVGNPNSISLILPTKSGLKMVSYYLQKPQENLVYQTIMGHHQLKNTDITVDYKEKSDASLLVREEVALSDSFQPLPDQAADREILSPNVQEGSLKISFAYFEGKENDGKIVWKNQWKGKYIPSGVHFEITFKGSGKDESAVKIEKTVFIPHGYLQQ